MGPVSKDTHRLCDTVHIIFLLGYLKGYLRQYIFYLCTGREHRFNIGVKDSHFRLQWHFFGSECRNSLITQPLKLYSFLAIFCRYTGNLFSRQPCRPCLLRCLACLLISPQRSREVTCLARRTRIRKSLWSSFVSSTALVFSWQNSVDFHYVACHFHPDRSSSSQVDEMFHYRLTVTFFIFDRSQLVEDWLCFFDVVVAVMLFFFLKQ